MRGTVFIAVAPVLLQACSSTPVVNPTGNLQYPVDMTMVCLDMVGTTVLSGQPMKVCHQRDLRDPPMMNSSGQRIKGTFGFIVNPGTSELAVADMDSGRLLDLAAQAPGYGLLPVSGNPQALAASDDGCWVVTSNRSSCDFTLVDPARLLAGAFLRNGSPAVPATAQGDSNHRLVVKSQSGRPLQASTGEIAFLPPTSVSTTCDANDKPIAVATFPGCDLVATLSLSFSEGTATIVNGYYVRPDLPGGFLAAGPEPYCPADCLPFGEAGLPAEVDAGASDGGVDGSVDNGGSTRGNVRYLQPLALVPGGSRVYVGSLFDTAVTSFDVTHSGLSNPTRFELAESPVGINRLRLGVDPYRTTPDPSNPSVTDPFLRNRGKFLYAFTRDDSVRVVNIDGDSPVECDVNVVPPSDETEKASSCFAVGSKPRRALAKGPGIRIPAFGNPNSPPPLPRDLAFAELMRPTDNDTNYQALSGQFGFLLASNGEVYVLNLAPKDEDGTKPIPATCQPYFPQNATTLPAAATHSFRDLRNVGQCSRVPTSLIMAPQRAPVASDQAFATVADFPASDGPLIKSFPAPSGSVDTTTRWIDFPDPDTIISRSWSIVWEGVLPFATRESGTVGGAAGPLAGSLTDTGAQFCTSSVQPGDVLAFSGCTQNSDCQPDNEFTCQGTGSGAGSMCLPIDGTASAALVKKCERFFGSRMRYEVVQVTSTGLSLGLKLDEVPKTSLNPCKTDSDCWPDADHGLQSAVVSDGGSDRRFSCSPVYSNDPHPRCVKSCTSDSDCRAGTKCEAVPGALTDSPTTERRLCVEAPPIDPECLPQKKMTRYSVRAGQSFLVSGSSLPTARTLAVAADGTCQPIPGLSPSLVSRIPLSAPACPPSFLAQAQSPMMVQRLTAQAGSNPCLYDGDHSDGDASTDAGVGPQSGRIRAYFQNPQIRFVLTNLDRYVADLFAIRFDLQYGFVPLTVSKPSMEILLSMGTRILTGPTKTPESPIRLYPDGTSRISYPYLYVIDQGRTALTPASHGQVLRINPRSGSNATATFDTAISGSWPFQLQ